MEKRRLRIFIKNDRYAYDPRTDPNHGKPVYRL